MKNSGFKMRGWSAFTKKAGPPTKGFDVDKTIDEDAQRVALTELTAELRAGEITKEQFEEKKKEISEYIDY